MGHGVIKKVFRWKGLLADKDPKARALAFGALLVVSAAMTFMQLGFIGIGTQEAYIGYVLGLFAPIAVSSLLLGKGLGCVEGMLSGAILVAHSKFQPLDVFEYAFVTPFSSIVLFGFMGFFVGLLYAIALRSDPRSLRRVCYLILVAAISSVVLSFLFLFGVAVSVVTNLAAQASDASGSVYYARDLVLSLVSLGDIRVQILGDFVLIGSLSIVASALEGWCRSVQRCASVRTTFCLWLLFVVVLVFLVTGSCGFVVITWQTEAMESQMMATEASNIASQLTFDWEDFEGASDNAALSSVDGVSRDSMVQAIRAGAAKSVLDGYTVENNGVVVVFQKGESGEYEVLYTDSDAFPAGASLSSIFGEAETDVIRKFAASGRMQRMLYTDEPLETSLFSQGKGNVSAQLGYVLITRVEDVYIMIMRPAAHVFAERSLAMLWTTFSAFIVLLVVYVVAARLLRKTVIEPIDTTNDSLRKITDGDLAEVVRVRGNSEFIELSKGINGTVDALKGWIAEAETRMEHELATAKAIQESALPRTFPPFPGIEQFDIYATMNAAKEVGGDFYDYFLIDDHTLGFLIADVSGKGVPGALFMMAAKTELENYISSGMDLAQAITGANQALCANNDAGMFVTVWAATLDYETGQLSYVNAGHNPPLLRRGQGGSWEWVTTRCGLFLGTFQMAKYRTATLSLRPGDELLLYTDGVSEAFNDREEQFGNNRLEAFASSHASLHPRKMVGALRDEVAAWAHGAEQSDDITILVLEYGIAPAVTGSLTVEATIQNLEQVCSLVRDELRVRMCPPDVGNKIEVALEELFVNVCSYAYPDRETPGMVTVSYVYSGTPPTMAVKLRDEGVPFDPLSRRDPTKPQSIDDVKIGGLGIFMVRRSMDSFTYERDGAENVVTFSKSW